MVTNLIKLPRSTPSQSELGRRRRRRNIFIQQASNSYTLSANSGSYSLTGQTAGLLKNSLVSCSAGSYTLTGTDAGVFYNHVVTIDSGSYTLSLTDAGLLKSTILTVASGSYTFTGTDVGFLKSFVLTANSGSYTLSGTDAGLLKTTIMTVDSGSYIFTGSDIGFLKGLILTVSSGSFTYSPTDAGLLKTWLLPIDSGSYLLSLADATLFKSYICVADSGSYILSLTDASILKTWLLTVNSGNYVLTGTNALLYPAGDLMFISIDPGIDNVRAGITYMINDVELAGTLIVPAVTDVRFGTGYGANGIEYVGTYQPGVQSFINNIPARSKQGQRTFYELKVSDGRSVDLYYNIREARDLNTGNVTRQKDKISIRRAVLSSMMSKYSVYTPADSQYQKTDSIILVDLPDLPNYVEGKEDYFVIDGLKYMIVTHEFIPRDGHVFVVRHIQQEAPAQEIVLNIQHFVRLEDENDQS